MHHLRLRHLTGPLTGRQEDFPLDRLRILIGTASHCPVRYPATPGVTPEHCELVRDAGRYEIRVNSVDAVFIDGRPAADDEELADGATVRLGSPEGPAFEVRYVDRATARPAGAAQRRGRFLARHRGTFAVGLVLAAIGAGLAAREVAVRRRLATDQRLLQMDSRIAQALAAANRPPDPGWPAMVDRIRPSVYLLVEKSAGRGEQAFGTAWVLAPGWLATNAHVADEIARVRRQSPNHRIVARSSVEPYIEVVKRTLQHPAFSAFRETWQEFEPTSVDAAGRVSNRELVLGYDVAALQVESSRPLEAPLKRASQETLRGMRPGEAVAFVGFPVERLFAVDLTRPNPRSQIGSIVALSTFTRTKAAEDPNLLIEHSIPATGGASGSPIINRRGEVVGLLSGGNIVLVNGGRIANPALVNFAQRVDLLEPLTANAPPLDLAAMRRGWLADLRRYGNREQLIEEDITRLREQWAGKHRGVGTPRELRSDTLAGPWSASLLGRPRVSMVLELEPGEYFIAVRGQRDRQVEASALYYDADRLLPTVLARAADGDSYPLMELTLAARRQVVVSVSDTTKSAAGETDPGPKPVRLTVVGITR